MRIPGLELYRTVEFRVDAPTARRVCEQYRRESVFPDDISVVRFEPVFVFAVATARSDSTADTFLRFHSEGESGWLAIDGSGKVIGHCWRLDNKGKGVVKRQVVIPVGCSWLHFEWIAPSRRGQGIMPALLSMSMMDALAQPTWFVRGFSTDIEVANHASQCSSEKVGFVPVSCVTSLRIHRYWFVLRSSPLSEDLARWTGR